MSFRNLTQTITGIQIWDIELRFHGHRLGKYIYLMKIQISVSVFQIYKVFCDVIVEGMKQIREKNLKSKPTLTDCISAITSWGSCLLTLFSVILVVVKAKKLEQIYKKTGNDRKFLLRIIQLGLQVLLTVADWQSTTFCPEILCGNTESEKVKCNFMVIGLEILYI